MLLFFQVGTAVYGTSLLAPRHLHNLLKYFGATAAYLPAVMIILVLLAQHVFQKRPKAPWKIQPKVLAGMFGESILWMIPLIGLTHLTGRLAAQQASPPPAEGFLSHESQEFLRQLLLAVGAGIYEEFLFRLIFISLMVLVFVDIFRLRKDLLAVLAVIAGAVAFSLYHLAADQLVSMSTFPWPKFLFRAVAGIYLGMVFVYRGFGITVGAHAFYNIYVLASQP